jgi:hypothetical protein
MHWAKKGEPVRRLENDAKILTPIVQAQPLMSVQKELKNENE